MKKILKVLKKYILGILLVVILLIVQAKCDLALPEYISNIINIGIQQKGIEDEIPNVITSDSLDIISLIATDETIKDNYKRVIKGDKNYIKEYPILTDEDIYILKDLNEEERKNLSQKIASAEAYYFMLTTSEDIKNKGYTVDLTMLSYFFKSTEDNELKNMYKSVKEIDSDLLRQYAVNFVSSEYHNIGINLEKLQMEYLIRTGIKMIVLSLFIMVVIVATTYLSGRIASSFAYDLRSQIVNKVMNYSNAEFNEFSTSSLITRTTNDVGQIQMLLTMLLRMILYAPIIGVGALVKVADIDMVWVVALAIGAVLILIITLLLFAMPKFKIVQKLIDRINLVVREILNGLPVIRAFANENFEIKKFNKANTDLIKVNLFTQRLMALMSPMMMLIMNGTCILIYWICADYIDAGSMQVGTLMALVSYTMQIIMSFLMLSMISIIAPRAIIAINRISDVLSKEESIKNKDKCIPFDENKKGVVEFKNVSFKYPDGDELVLNDLSFKVETGSTLAIIGSTGSGKSTIVNLIPRFFDVSCGNILVDGVDVRDADIFELRKRIGIVPQKGLLFSGTIESNIKFSNPNMSDEEMIKAADIACASEFINKKSERYQSEIAQGGTTVSGGQRQRLSIARAVAKNPEIYIFDDSFSALDYKTDSQVRKNLNQYCNDATKIIVAQRVATVIHADQIIVLDQGRVVGIGNHKELYKNCKVYKEIALSQLKEEELV